MKVAVLDQNEVFRELAGLRHPAGATDGQAVAGGSTSGMLLSSIVRSVPDVIYQLDGEGRILFINDAIKQYGYDPEELTGTSIFDLVHPGDRDRARHRLNERRSGERSTRLFEVRLLARNQEPVSFEFAPSAGQLEAPTLLVTAEGIYSQDQDRERRFLCTQGVARDITERRRTQEALERVNHELEARVAERTTELQQVNAELRQQLDRQRRMEAQLEISRRLEAVGQLTAGVAHHFNNMLQGVVGNLYLAELRASEEIRPLLDSAKSAADRAAEMVRQLMLIARQGMHESPRRLDLVPILQTTLDLARETFGPHIRLTAVMPPSPVVVVGVADQLRQAFFQLLLNSRDAVEATREPAVTVRLDLNPIVPRTGTELPSARYLRVEVEDNGVGMDEDTCRRAFDPFFTTKPVGYATGLGLPAVHAIVQQHGGRVECRSTLGAGTCLTLFLPLPEEE